MIYKNNREHNAYINITISDAVRENQLLVLVTDDYTNIHTK